MRSTRFHFALVLIASLPLARSAHAGDPELFAQVAFHPRDPDVISLRYVNGGEGIFQTRDRGEHWQLQCGSGVEQSLIHILPLSIAGDGKSLIGGELQRATGDNYKTLLQDDGQGCSWRARPEFDGRTVVDLVRLASDLDVMFASISDTDMLNGILRRDMTGAWSDVGARSDAKITRLLVTTTKTGLRFYEATYWLPPGALDTDGGVIPWPGGLRVSDDERKTWREQAFGSFAQQRALLDVDPSNPDRVLATESLSDGRDQILVSRDQGATFTEYLTLTDFRGLAFAPDGRVWIADGGAAQVPAAPKGIWFSTSLDEPAQKLADFRAGCVGYQSAGDQLYACRFVPAADAFGPVDMSNGSFKSLLRFAEVKDFAQCAGVDTAAVCKQQMCGAYCGFGHFAQAPICDAYSGPSCGPCAADPGSPACTGSGGSKAINAGLQIKDAGISPRKKSSGCACSVLGQPSNHGVSPALLAIAGITLRLCSRRRDRHRCSEAHLA